MNEDHETKYYETQQKIAEVELEIEKARLLIAQTEVEQTKVRLLSDEVVLEFKHLELENLKYKSFNNKNPEMGHNIVEFDKSKMELEQLTIELDIMKKREEIREFEQG